MSTTLPNNQAHNKYWYMYAFETNEIIFTSEFCSPPIAYTFVFLGRVLLYPGSPLVL